MADDSGSAAGGPDRASAPPRAPVEGEAWFRCVFESSPLGIAVVRRSDQRIVEANPRFRAMLGYTAEELLRRSVGEITHPDDWQAEQPLIERIRAGLAEHYTIEKRYIAKDGSARWARLTAASVVQPPGEEPLAIGIVEEITQQRQAEDELREKARLNTVLLDAMPCAAMLVEAPSRRLVAANRMAVEMGAEPGKTCFEAWMGHPEPCAWCGSEQVIRTQEAQHAEVEFAGRFWHLEWIPISPTVYLHYAFDITRQKEHEERLRQLQGQLAHVARVAAVGELSAGIAHEVNQPLYTIMNFAKACANLAAQEAPDLESLRLWTREIVAAATRAGEIIRRLRDFVRRGDQERSAVAVRRIVDEAAHLLGLELRHQGIELAIECDEREVLVHADPIQIEQVLLNLLHNAVEAISERTGGRRRILVRVRATGTEAEFSVSDTGPGLPEIGSGRLFEPFVTNKPGGLGMGLAISRGIVEAHGGRLWAENNAEGGATFLFTLPQWTEGSDV